MNKRSLEHTLDSVVVSILRPLVRILLRNGMAYGKFAELAKWVYVDVASRDFTLEGRKQSASRVSVITGLNRKEVAHMQSITPIDEEYNEDYNRAAKVVASWMRDYPDPSGEGARNLPFLGDKDSFTQLVKKYSGDMPARAVLDELLVSGAVIKEPDNMLRLAVHGYVPHGVDATQLAILGQDVSDLIATIDHNHTSQPDQSYFQRTMFSNNISVEAAEILRLDAMVHAQSLLDHQNKQLAIYDRDVSPAVGGTGRKRVTLGIYFYANDYMDSSVEAKPLKSKNKPKPPAD
jgi:Family of unknown function (DUF6502)